MANVTWAEKYSITTATREEDAGMEHRHELVKVVRNKHELYTGNCKKFVNANVNHVKHLKMFPLDY